MPISFVITYGVISSSSMAATRRPALDSAARCPPEAMTSGNWEASTLTADYGDGRSRMRAIFEGVGDGRDAFATVAELGHAILGEVGVKLVDPPSYSEAIRTCRRNVCAVYVTIG